MQDFGAMLQAALGAATGGDPPPLMTPNPSWPLRFETIGPPGAGGTAEDAAAQRMGAPLVSELGAAAQALPDRGWSPIRVKAQQLALAACEFSFFLDRPTEA